MTAPHDRSTGESPVDLLGDVVAGIARLVRGEMALARAEAKRSISDASFAVGLLAVGAILTVTALNVLSAAAVAGLVALGLSPIWATVAVGAGLLLLAYLLVLNAMARLKVSSLAPKRVMDNLRHDAETLKSMVISDATTHSQR